MSCFPAPPPRQHAARRRPDLPLHPRCRVPAAGRQSSGRSRLAAGRRGYPASLVTASASFQALKVQDLYRISLETHLRCSKCHSTQIRSSYVLNLQLHVRAEHDSLVLFNPKYLYIYTYIISQECCYSYSVAHISV